MRNSVLFISYDGMTDNLGQSQVIPYLIGLRKKGYPIHILSCEKPAAFEKRKEHVAKLLEREGIAWHPIPYTATPPIFSTLFDIRNLQDKACEIIRNKQIALLHCRSYISAHIGVYCKKRFGIPWVFDMRGFWADERVEGGIWDRKKLAYRLVYNYFKKMEAQFVASASHIVSLTQNGADEIRTWKAHRQANTPISVIPCCADLQLFRYRQEAKSLVGKALGIPQNAFVVSYLGSFGTWYLADEMFDCFKAILSRIPHAVFLCITPDNPDRLDSLAMRKDIPRAALRVVAANREDVPLYASASDWSMFFIKPVYSKKASSPTKMGELLALGIPLVCNAGVGDVDSIMKDCAQGLVVQDFTAESYAKVAEKLQEAPPADKASLRSVAEKYYSLENGVATYEAVYQAVLSR